MRLPSILFLMALVLGAGVLGVLQLESRVGATTVPGVIVLDVPGLDPTTAQDLTRRYEAPRETARRGSRPLGGARMEWVAVDAEVLSPFGLAATRARAERGEATVLFDPVGQSETDWHVGWSVVLGPDIRTGAAGRMARAVEVARAAEQVAEFVREQTGTRPFRVGLVLGDTPAADIDDLLAPIVAAADALPSFRRTSILVLGKRMPMSPRRLCVRIDRGRWDGRARPALGDLLQDGP